MSNKQAQKIADWDLEDYFPNGDVFQEFLEMFGDATEDEVVDMLERANEFAEDHNIPLTFMSVDMNAEPDQFVWEVIVDKGAK